MDGPRYRAVRVSRLSPLDMKAGIEDAKTGRTIYVVNADLALHLAGLLNAHEEGEPLPSPSSERERVRCQLAHSPYLSTGITRVIAMEGIRGRTIAAAPGDEVAELVASLLDHTGYPARGRGSPRPSLADLPPASLAKQRTLETSHRRWGAAAIVLHSLLPMGAALALVAWVFGWPLVAISAGGMLLLLLAVTFAMRLRGS